MNRHGKPSKSQTYLLAGDADADWRSWSIFKPSWQIPVLFEDVTKLIWCMPLPRDVIKSVNPDKRWHPSVAKYSFADDQAESETSRAQWMMAFEYNTGQQDLTKSPGKLPLVCAILGSQAHPWQPSQPFSRLCSTLGMVTVPLASATLEVANAPKTRGGHKDSKLAACGCIWCGWWLAGRGQDDRHQRVNKCLGPDIWATGQKVAIPPVACLVCLTGLETLFCRTVDFGQAVSNALARSGEKFFSGRADCRCDFVSISSSHPPICLDYIAVINNGYLEEHGSISRWYTCEGSWGVYSRKLFVRLWNGFEFVKVHLVVDRVSWVHHSYGRTEQWSLQQSYHPLQPISYGRVWLLVFSILPNTSPGFVARHAVESPRPINQIRNWTEHIVNSSWRNQEVDFLVPTSPSVFASPLTPMFTVLPSA
ncbi:hypothetical protein B0T13DRAFT_451721 [Neurospora crassa]|nr:hypothetical protein B0T13DRAFT_451721 [Neurospora crassa]